MSWWHQIQNVSSWWDKRLNVLFLHCSKGRVQFVMEDRQMLTFCSFLKFLFNIFYTPIPYLQPAPLYIFFFILALHSLYFLPYFLCCVNTRMLVVHLCNDSKKDCDSDYDVQTFWNQGCVFPQTNQNPCFMSRFNNIDDKEIQLLLYR